MVSPLLDEDRIMAMLLCEPLVTNSSRLQAAAMLAVADAHDRKCTRDEFIVLLDIAMNLHTDAGKFFMMDSIAGLFHTNALDFEMVTTAVAKITEKTTRHQYNLARFVERLIQCPETEDRVH